MFVVTGEVAGIVAFEVGVVFVVIVTVVYTDDTVTVVDAGDAITVVFFCG